METGTAKWFNDANSRVSLALLRARAKATRGA